MPEGAIGLIIPSSNPTIERWLQRAPVAATLGASFLCTRLPVRRIATDAGSDAQFGLDGFLAAAELLADAEVDAVLWAGTSGFWLGPGVEDAVLAGIAASTGRPASSARGAMFAALAEAPGPDVAVLTPYTEPVHERVCATFAAAGRRVAASRALGIERNLDFAAVPQAAVDAEARALAEASGAPVALVCTNVLGTSGGLSGTPVVDSVLATLWHGARIVGATDLDYAQAHRRLCAAG
jgi:maleate isomerase